MFLSKINGSAQTELFDRLQEFYDRGITSLLRLCSFLRPYVDILIQGIKINEIYKKRNSVWSYVWCVVFEEFENNDLYLLNLQNFIEARYLLK